MRRPGFLYRNGHGQCGCCGHVVDGLAGGRRERKREGWRYEPTTLGWVCGGCSALLTWPGDVEKSRGCGKRAADVDNAGAAGGSVRGFGAKRAQVPELERLKAQRRKVTRRERRKLRALQDRAQLAGKAGARANRPKDLHTRLEARGHRPPVRTLSNP